MAFDQKTRNLLQRTVTACRRVFDREFTAQLQELYGIQPDGSLTPYRELDHLVDEDLEVAGLLRSRINHLEGGEPAEAFTRTQTKPEHVARVIREQAFTVLNRLAALRLCEERGLVLECVRRSVSSEGFQLFLTSADNALGETHEAYRIYLHCVFDELAIDLGVLFDRFSPLALLFPRKDALEEVLRELNGSGKAAESETIPAEQFAGIWKADETIGWIYQYYNDEAERKQMRKDSPAPRDSRELAVRNQFFTPRYVVEFLTDNTLGRLWLEMTGGETALRDRCRYLVRRPKEIFLKAGAVVTMSAAGREAQAGETLSQEDLLRQPVHIPHRPMKDPREILLLDPACGSMHFGLYAFDIFSVIYEEAWEIAHSPQGAAESGDAFASFVTFAAPFRDKAAFLLQVPRLIIEHNVHGIDIDPRAVQIAGLSLWLRAQRAWHQAGVAAPGRPSITRSNIVCAEPMPGEKEMLGGFVEEQFVASERPAFAYLLRKIFDRMSLAGEAGSLLRIEEEIRAVIIEASALAQKQSAPRQDRLWVGDERPEQSELNLRGLNDEQFWGRAEQRIYDALKTYAEQTESAGGFQRRLFANDAAQGFAFIDLCRKRYDVMVMNPPFGSPPASVTSTLSGDAASNVYPAFVLRGAELCDGFVGAITDRTFVVQQSFGKFRTRLISDLGLIALVELGWGVLDGADVQVAAYFVRKGNERAHLFVSMSPNGGDPAAQLLSIVSDSKWTALSKELIHKLPNSAFAHTLPAAYLSHLESQVALQELAMLPRGLGSNDANRTYKAWYEVPVGSIGEGKTYRSLSNGGPFSPFYRDDAGVAEWLRSDGKLLVEEGYSETTKAYDQKGNPLYFAPGLSFPKQASSFNVSALPEDAIPTREGKGIVPKKATDRLPLLAYLNSAYARYFVEATNGLHKQSGPVGMTPVPKFSPATRVALSSLALEAWRTIAETYLFDEASRSFVRPATAHDSERIGDCDLSTILKNIDDVLFEEVGVGLEDREALSTQPRGAPASFQPAESDALSYAFGCTFGRWDIRYATGERPAPELPDPFAPLPVCPPGMLQGGDGVPLSPEAGRRLRAEKRYPLDVAWDGILVDDPEHPLDVERRVRAAVATLWGDRVDAMQHEACALLGVPALRDWFRRPAGFFADHLKRYSKSRRQAPIYWPLSTSSGRYTLWVYYHRLTPDTLYKCLQQFVVPKLADLEKELTQVRTVLAANEGGGKERKRMEELEDLRRELIELRTELELWAPRWKPNLNDGVLITAAPLWKLFRLPKWQKDLKACWRGLEKEEYDWAHLAYGLWPDRIREKCKSDRSLAIAHGLENLCEVKVPLKKVKKSKTPKIKFDQHTLLNH